MTSDGWTTSPPTTVWLVRYRWKDENSKMAGHIETLHRSITEAEAELRDASMRHDLYDVEVHSAATSGWGSHEWSPPSRGEIKLIGRETLEDEADG